jgi:uncharacterized integral membrane protein
MTDEHQDPFEVEGAPHTEPELREAGASPDGRETPTRRPEATGVAWGAILAFVGIALVIVFSVQNTDPVLVRFFWMEGEHPLAIVILITIGVVILLTELIGISYRRRRRRRRDEKEELRRLRDA